MSHISRTAVVLIILQATLIDTAKNTARPVHEVVNEQARIDDKRPFLYTNPLAVTSNAKLHAQHQQAMFNAERVRQHRAQSQRWMQAPQIDSYMKAYQESQENHQLALERMQSNLNKRPVKQRQEKTLQDKEIKIPELTKITRADAMVDKNRNHRSYGSVYYSPQKKRKINTAPGATYDQGVTIKPNGNIGVNNFEDESRLYTEAVPSKTQFVYPKLYSQMHGYQTVEDIEALNYLLSKPADEQLTELNALYNKEESLDKPMDVYFYLKDPVVKQVYSAPYNRYLTDEKPITEAIDDVEDPNKFTRFQAYGIQGVITPQTDTETTTKKSNYYIEVEQTVSGNKPADLQYTTQYAVVQDKPSFQALTYEKPVANYPKEESGKYLHHETSGVQHLSEDGTGVSAYGDDDIHYAANYEFGYRVRDHETGNDFGHQEAKSGKQTRGQYHVVLPDGRRQQVRYSAGPQGYHADISYEHLQ